MWTHNSPKNVPAFAFKTARSQPATGEREGDLLLIEDRIPHRRFSWDTDFEFAQYQEEQFRSVGLLPDRIHQHLTVRLHPGFKSMRWADEKRWRECRPHTSIDTGAACLQDLTARSRLVVHSFDSTGILETLALNIPTLCFWRGGLNHLLLMAQPLLRAS